jgi:hypothetical protein
MDGVGIDICFSEKLYKIGKYRSIFVMGIIIFIINKLLIKLA